MANPSPPRTEEDSSTSRYTLKTRLGDPLNASERTLAVSDRT